MKKFLGTLALIATAAGVEGARVRIGDPEAVVADARVFRTGVVRKLGKTFNDDQGPFFPIGGSLFPYWWAVMTDEPRAIANLDAYARVGADHIRVCGAMGEGGPAESDTWFDRTVSPADPRLPAAMRRGYELMRQRGLRAVVSVVCDRTRAVRSDATLFAHLDAVLAAAEEYRDAILYLTASNEGYGFPKGKDDPTIVEMTRRIRARGFLAGGVSDRDLPVGDIFPIHPDRDIVGDAGRWEYVEQIYSFRSSPRMVFVQEPIGPQSSVHSDDDPVRQAAYVAMAMITRASGFTWHLGAGVRLGGAWDTGAVGDRKGQNDGQLPRFSNIYEQPTLGETWRRFRAVRDFLPPGMADWNEVHHSDPSREGRYPFATGPLQPFEPARWFLKTYANRSGNEFAGAFVKVERDVPLRATRAMTVRVLDLTTLEESERGLKAGETWTVTARGAFVFRGTWN